MRKKCKQGNWVMLMLALAVWCVGCSDHDSSTGHSNQPNNFDPTPLWQIDQRKKDLMRFLPKETYDKITEGTKKCDCREKNRVELNLPDKPNWEWYYTYENLIEGMAKWEEFAAEGDDNTRKLEIAAFLANIAQETGTHAIDDPYGGPGCAIQEGYGAYWNWCTYGGCNNVPDYVGKTCQDNKNLCPDGGVGYGGRGPHQLSHNYNYQAFGEAMDEGNRYLKDPDLLTQEPKTGMAGSIWFWGHADLGSGKNPEKPFKPSAHEVAVGKWQPTDDDKACGRETANFGVIINIINGGIECGPGAVNPQAAQNRVNYLTQIAKVMGVNIPEGFLNNCSAQKNFAACASYPRIPDDPTKRCGKDWQDANSRCGQCCTDKPDCPDGESCFQTNKPEEGGLTCTCKN